MAVLVYASVHAEPADLGADRFVHGAVVLSAGTAALFIGGSKADTLAGLARWTELVEALPDDEGP